MAVKMERERERESPNRSAQNMTDLHMWPVVNSNFVVGIATFKMDAKGYTDIANS